MTILRYFKQAIPSTILLVVFIGFFIYHLVTHKPISKLVFIAIGYIFYTIMAFGQNADRIEELENHGF